jgi:rhodanese-related sulfurtransferase
MSSETPLWREVFVLVVAGTVLGIVYNGMGVTSRPPRGIPWVAAKAELPSLEDMTPPDSGMAAPGGETSAPDAGGPTSNPEQTSTPPASTGDGRGRDNRTAGSDPRSGEPAAGITGTSGAAPSGTAATPAGSGDPAPTAPATASALPDLRPTASLPFIPETGQPIQVQLPTVKRFFDARAALFLDARDPAEYEKGHIPGAIRLTNPEAQNEPERMKALPVEGRPTVVYCEGGTCEASLDLARFLIESGFKKVLVYMGGFPEWEAAGHAVERGSGR